MTIPIPEVAALGTMIWPSHTPSPTATPSSTHALLVACPRDVDDWTMDVAFAPSQQEDGHQINLHRMAQSLSECAASRLIEVGTVSGSGTSLSDLRFACHWNSVFHESGGSRDEHSTPSGAVLQYLPWLWAVPVSSALLSRTVEPARWYGYFHRDLRDALFDLDQAEDEAREEGFPAPSGRALGNARRLLYAMYRTSPRRFEIYPTPDGEIAIDAPGGPGRSVLLLCGSDGGALCLVNMNGAHRRARYSDTHRLPDGFVSEALSELEQAG